MTKRTLTYVVTAEPDGAMVNDALRRGLKISGSLIKELKRHEDGILLNGAHARTVDAVKPGDVIECNMYDAESENVIAADTQLDIMYEDEDILIINKPPRMPVHPSPGHLTDTLANGVIAHYRKNGETHIFRAVNRLDGDTSGVMCIAKNSYAHARLIDEMAAGELRREYMAIVEGELEGNATIDAPIMRVDFIKRAVCEGGHRAVTHYMVSERFCGYTLVRLRLETGRTHQIRVHMSHIGHPLLGDWLYGTEDKELFPRHALHSAYLRFIHPVTGELMEFAPPMPGDMEQFIAKLGKFCDRI
ncbi:MAG: RluA family pseudouridine synthase [Clostridia bacterium]|nr:RluA family pseudouridine synthase [Clostridia bacterium]